MLCSDPDSMTPTIAQVSAGTTFTIPASFSHCQINFNCQPLVFHATLKADAGTQLVLTTLQVMSTRDLQVYATTAAAKGKPGSFGMDATCV